MINYNLCLTFWCSLKTFHEINEMNSFFSKLDCNIHHVGPFFETLSSFKQVLGRGIGFECKWQFQEICERWLLTHMKAFLMNFPLQIKLDENPQGKGCSQEQQTQKKIIYCFHVYSTLKCLIPPSLWWENQMFFPFKILFP